MATHTHSDEQVCEDDIPVPSVKSKKRIPFEDLGEAESLRLFLDWLPKEIHDAPGIDWRALPQRSMCYLIRTVKDLPEANLIAIAVAAAQGSLQHYSLQAMLGQLYSLLRTLHQMGLLHDSSNLQDEQVWSEYAQKTTKAYWRCRCLQSYAAFSELYLPAYLQRLSLDERQRMQPYALPRLPYGYLKRVGDGPAIDKASRDRRKAQSDIVVPLFPVLRQIVRFRKQVAERTFKAIRQARSRVEAGEVILPYSFEHTDTLPFVNRDAKTIAAFEIQGRQVTMHFTLWDKRVWVFHHKDRFSPSVLSNAQHQTLAYSDEQNQCFVQYHGSANDLLWFGNLVDQRLFQVLGKGYTHDDAYRERFRLARQLGFTSGCSTSRAGLLHPADAWFAYHTQPGDFLFEPESLYRGILYGAALTTIALTNGSRVSELLQVSWDRRVMRTEMVTILEPDGKLSIGPDGKPVTREQKMYLQNLLPKGSKTEEEQQLFPLGKEAMRLLSEIQHLLKETHGEIPVVHPSRNNSKYEHLTPERYLFQWGASAKEKHGILLPSDVQMLIRFMLYGLELCTSQGEPIRVTVHLLRHIMATHARHYRHVPSEVIAHFFLHHRLKGEGNRLSSHSVVSDYYFQMPEEQRLALIQDDLHEQEAHDRSIMLREPTARDLEVMNDDLRAVYEQWQTLHPTAFGNCGCPGLCPRGYNRSLCLGCSYLVTDPEKIGAALVWRRSYAKQVEMLEAQGNVVDARQAFLLVQQLDDLINMMHLQLQAEADGRYVPLYKLLPSPYREMENCCEEES